MEAIGRAEKRDDGAAEGVKDPRRPGKELDLQCIEKSYQISNSNQGGETAAELQRGVSLIITGKEKRLNRDLVQIQFGSDC